MAGISPNVIYRPRLVALKNEQKGTKKTTGKACHFPKKFGIILLMIEKTAQTDAKKPHSPQQPQFSFAKLGGVCCLQAANSKLNA